MPSSLAAPCNAPISRSGGSLVSSLVASAKAAALTRWARCESLSKERLTLRASSSLLSLSVNSEMVFNLSANSLPNDSFSFVNLVPNSTSYLASNSFCNRSFVLSSSASCSCFRESDVASTNAWIPASFSRSNAFDWRVNASSCSRNCFAIKSSSSCLCFCNTSMNFSETSFSFSFTSSFNLTASHLVRSFISATKCITRTLRSAISKESKSLRNSSSTFARSAA
mmetsp:Transcript_13428/g.20348  ORF Transcript_13428/g.20348 Transcript_13428/m.20348 type:complete len:225 (+) Transcript_13428:527-1201(+)